MEDIRIEEIIDKINVPGATYTRPNVIEDTEKVCNIFCCAALGDANTGVLHIHDGSVSCDIIGKHAGI